MEKREARIKANYRSGELVHLFFSLLYTKLFFRGCRLIRLPARIRGKKGIVFGKGFTVGYSSRIAVGGDLKKKKLVFGQNVVIGDYCHIEANYNIKIGDNCLLASRVFITDTLHGSYGAKEEEASIPSIPPNDRPLSYRSVSIGANCWIGENVCILPGVSVGDGCVIGAGSIVTKSFEQGCIICGNPARAIKRFVNEKGAYEKIL